MIQQRLQEWIAYPERLNEDTLFELREVLRRFPYFQTARLLYLKNLFLLKDASFKDELRKSVLYVADLSQLFYGIEGSHFAIEKHKSDLPVGNGPQAVDRTLALIDRFLSDTSDSEPETELPVQPEASLDYMSVLLQEDMLQEKTVEPSPRLKGQDLIDSFIEKDSLLSERGNQTVPSALLQYTEDEEEETVEKADILLPHQEIESVEERDVETTVGDNKEAEEGEYFTETLAKIYVKQQRYDKALEIIKKLNLKYPKKNAYFADQIRFLEKLIINAKSK